MSTITISLVSHTNVGKTTLARTLLRRDIGEVRDEAHVTEDPEDHVLIETADGQDRLVLWDTPGFGDSARLWRSLKRESNPFGWFLNEVWDRMVDRPFWCSQQAIRNVREKADAVLYLVNASEDPAGAGYVTPELEILGWMGQPVLSTPQPDRGSGGAPSTSEDVARWREHFGSHPAVADVTSLDAFTRCWVQEGLLLERVAAALPEDRRPTAARLLEAWTERNLEVYRSSISATAGYLARTAADSEPMTEEGLVNVGRREMATKRLATRLDATTREWLTSLVAGHGLEGEAAAKVRTRLEDFSLPEETVEPWKAGALGGALSGALAGLAADIAAGGLTFGGGFVTGAILGGLGSAGVAHAVQVMRDSGVPRVRFGPEFLDRLTLESLLRYLAVAHAGRGAGDFEEREHPSFWVNAVERALQPEQEALRTAWTSAGEGQERPSTEQLERVLRATVREVMEGFYPGVDGILK